MGWEYVGARPSDPRDLVDVQYVTERIAALNLSQATVDDMIALGLTGFTNKSYVDTQDLLNATKAYVDAGDATRLHTAQIGANGGILPTDANGRIPLSRLNISADQVWPAPYTSPSTYHTTDIAVTATETTLYPVTVADPGFPYKLMIFGTVDAKTSTDGQYPVINVRAGSTSGPIVAYGYGNAEHYRYPYINLTPFSQAGSFPYVPQSALLDVVTLGAGGGGSSGAVYQSGRPGAAGNWNGAQIAVTVGVPITVNVGAAGPGGPSAGWFTSTTGGNGGTTTVSGPGFSPVSATGGAGGAGTSGGTVAARGGDPVSFTFDGFPYTGGQGGQWISGSPGQAAADPGNATAPGGGGGAGGTNFIGASNWTYAGGSGADGGAWIGELIPTGSMDPDNVAPVSIMSVAMSTQPVFTGAVTLYVRLARGGGTTATVTAKPFKPTLWVTPIAA